MPIVPKIDVDRPGRLGKEHQDIDSETDRNDQRTNRGIICNRRSSRPSHIEYLKLKSIYFHDLAQCRAESAGQKRSNDGKTHKTDSHEQSALESLAEFDADAHTENGEDDRHHHCSTQTNDITEYLFHIPRNYFGCLPIYARIPPSTYSTCPFMKSDALEARNTTGPIRSSGVPQRSAGVLATMKESKG